MALTYIHVNRNILASNLKHGTCHPAVRLQKGKYGKPVYCYQVDIKGPSRVIYSPDKPLLPCGARLVIETEAEVDAML